MRLHSVLSCSWLSPAYSLFSLLACTGQYQLALSLCSFITTTFLLPFINLSKARNTHPQSAHRPLGNRFTTTSNCTHPPHSSRLLPGPGGGLIKNFRCTWMLRSPRREETRRQVCTVRSGPLWSPDAGSPKRSCRRVAPLYVFIYVRRSYSRPGQDLHPTRHRILQGSGNSFRPRAPQPVFLIFL